MSLYKNRVFCKTAWLGFFLICFNCEYIFAINPSADLAQSKESQAKESIKTWNAEAYHKTADLFSEAANIWIKIDERQKAAAALRESARLLLVLADYKKALGQLQEALEIDERNNFLDGKSETLSLLALISQRNGQIEESRKYFQQALGFSRLTENPSVKANALYSAAQFNYSYGDAHETIKFLQQALSYAEKTDDKNLTAQILLYLGFGYARQGNPVAGLENVKKSLEKWKEAEDIRGQATAYFGIGFINTLMDEKQDALNSYRLSEMMFPEDMNWLEKGRLYNGIATVYEDFGQILQALNYRQKAIIFFRKAEYPYGELATLPSLAKLNYLKGDKVSALNLYDETLSLAQKLNDNFHLAIVKEDLGNIKFDEGLYQEAINNYLEALKVYQKLKVQLPRVQNNLGRAFEKKGDFFLARQYYNSALEINRKTKDMISAAENLYNLSRLSEAENKTDIALGQIQESLQITESLTGKVVSNKLRSSYISSVFERYEQHIKLLWKMHRHFPQQGFDIQTLQVSERARARSLLETIQLSEADFTKDADAETIKREKEIRILLNAKADKLTELLSNTADKTETEKVSSEINELENELEEIKGKLKQQSPIYSAISNPAPFDVADFQKQALDENSLLLEFSFGKEESYLWLVGKTEVNSYILPPREQIEAKIQKLRELLASRHKIKGEEIEAYQARIAKADNDYWQAAKQLSDELFGQVANKFEKNRLIIVPDGKLNYFPVSALPLPNSETSEPILLSNEVVYEPSASTLLILAKSQKQTSGATKNLLVFSDPVFTKEDSRISAMQTAENLNAETALLESFRFVESLNSLSRLPASKTEADSIIDILGQSYTDNYSGFAAKREQLLNAGTADYKILHLATHGLINEERPELSGIVLSRFDENGQKIDEFVRLHDIYGMNLNSDLVVLSACETGIGKEVRGEGLQSLNNAFLQTGAKSVVSSLWKVEDNATLELMKNFYQSLANENTTPSKALQQAQIKMWQSGTYKSPFYWAAFTVQGDFRRAPDFSRDISYAIVFSAAGLGVLVFGMFWLYGRKRGRFGLLNRK